VCPVAAPAAPAKAAADQWVIDLENENFGLGCSALINTKEVHS
jgi:hypothetical protein